MAKRRPTILPIAWQRQRWQARELSRSLRESLLMDDDGWIVRGDDGVTSNTLVEFVAGGSTVRFSLKLLPCRNNFASRCCQTIQVRVDGAVVWLPILQRLLLKNVVRLFVARYANKVADGVLAN